MTPDVVVIGGGPAGLAAAIVCARHGLMTTLVERQAFPIDKACGEGLLPNGVDALRALGVRSDDLRGVAHEIAGIRYRSPRGRVAEATFGREHGLAIRRRDLSRTLLAKAQSLTSFRHLQGDAGVTTSDREGPEVAVGDLRLRPRVVIAADGLHSPVRRSLAITSIPRRPRRWGVRQHFDGRPWTDHVEVHFGRGFEAYVTPLADGINVAVLWDSARVTTRSGEGFVSSLIDALPELSRRLGSRRLTDRKRASGPFAVDVPNPIRSGLVLLGDAAGYVDALTGEGVGLALQQALLLETTLVPMLAATPVGHRVVEADLRPLVAGVRALCRANHQLTRFLLRLSRSPAVVEYAISLLASDAALFQHCLDVNLGRRSLWRLPLRSLVRLPASLVVGRSPVASDADRMDRLSGL